MLAAVLANVTIPAHALGLRLPWTQLSPGPAAAGPRPDRKVLASRPFLLLVSAATLCAFAQYAALVHLVPLLTDRGLSPGLAAWALGLGGAGQVAGRLCYRALALQLGARGRTVAIIAAGAAVTLLLGLLPGPAALLVAASVLAGAVRGVHVADVESGHPDALPGELHAQGVGERPLRGLRGAVGADLREADLGQAGQDVEDRPAAVGRDLGCEAADHRQGAEVVGVHLQADVVEVACEQVAAGG